MMVPNWPPSYLGHWRCALARIRAGTGRGKLLMLGDSTMMGSGAGTGGTLAQNAAYPNSQANDLVSRLNALGVTALNNSFLGDQNTGVALGTYDTRMTPGANWANGTIGTLGGNGLYYTSGSANNLSFTPGSSFDTITIWYTIFTGQGSCTVNVDGGSSLGTITLTPGFGLGKVTYTVSPGTHTINIVPNNNGNLGIVAIYTYLSTTTAIDVLQAGYSGGTVGGFINTSTPWQSAGMITAIAPDLTIIQLTINDSNNGTGVAAYTTSLQSLVTNALASGDVIIESGIPSNTSQATNGTLAQYIAAAKAVAATNNVPFIDINARLVSYAVQHGLGLMYDNLHMNATGYQDLAQAQAPILAFQ